MSNPTTTTNFMLDRRAVEMSWSIETTYCPDEYNERDPAWGQCAVTALYLWKRYGGDLMTGWAIHVPSGLGTKHYWNRFGDVYVDLTWRQFPLVTGLVEIEETSAEYILSNAWFVKRFEIFEASCLERLKDYSLEP